MTFIQNPVLQQNIQYLKGVGEHRAALYGRLGIVTVEDLLRHYPRGYIDFSNITPLLQAQPGQVCCIKAQITKKGREQRIRGNLSVFKVQALSDFTPLTITFFNSRFLVDQLHEEEEYLFYGKVSGNLLRREMSSPMFVKADAKIPLKPVYALTQGLTSNIIASHVRTALALLKEKLPDPLPVQMQKDEQLCSFLYALQNIHFPQNSQALATAKKRLIFDELLTLQLGLLHLKARNRQTTPVHMRPVSIDEFWNLLPYSPTDAQRRCVQECMEDMQRPTPMNRLLQGDVGSGKTLVAAAVCVYAIKNGYQAALMAPTEILAEQHMRSLETLLTPLGLKVAVLTGSTKAKEKKETLQALQNGEIHLLVGTHAILTDQVAFANLGLIITDEQHRFGVSQRARFSQKGSQPHTLVMSATPIPRTMALMVYGDLDISVLDQMPPGRQKVQTYLIDSSKRERAFGFLKKYLQQGRQAYIVCPLIEAQEENPTPVKMLSIMEYAQKIAGPQLTDYRLGILHGKVKASQKEAVMREFANGEIDVLLATTVIEVGVDVPNAVIMMIENAERFGLSQLHQLRGRVGRGNWESFCILVSDSKNEETRQRLKILCQTADGFALSQQDLRLRGPGEFFGSRQHGLPSLAIANMLQDIDTLQRAQELAKTVLQQDPALALPQNQGLAYMVGRLFGQTSVAFN